MDCFPLSGRPPNAVIAFIYHVAKRSGLSWGGHSDERLAQGDMAADRMIITDPLSGLSFEVSLYEKYRQIQYEIAAAWGCAAIKKEHLGLLLG